MIHETAIVSSKAKLGSDVEIGPYAIIEENVEIGDRGKIAGHAILKSGTRIGKSVTVESFCIIGGLPQDLGFDANTETYAAIGDRSVIREGSTINRALATIAGLGIGLLLEIIACSQVTYPWEMTPFLEGIPGSINFAALARASCLEGILQRRWTCRPTRCWCNATPCLGSISLDCDAESTILRR